MKILINTNQSKSVLARFRTKVDGLVPSTDFERQRNNLIRLVVNSMESSPDQWDNLCQINIGWIGDQFISRLSDEGQELSKDRLDSVCSMCFRFLFELYLSMKDDLAIEYESARRFVLNNINSFEEKAKEQIEYSIREMPIAIFKAISNSEAISSIKDFNSISSKAEQLKTDWETEISEKENRAKKLKESLESYENGFNFVGLYQGFDDLAKDKKEEKENLLFWIRIMSVLIVLPILAELIFVYRNIGDINSIKDVIIVSIFPTISLVVISIYYFRVLLFNFNSVKSQLLQIELRKTLCRFIQSYSDYSSDLKKKDSDLLSKFENIIFSGIVSGDNKLPSTYDGFEQLGKLIKSAKS